MALTNFRFDGTLEHGEPLRGDALGVVVELGVSGDSDPMKRPLPTNAVAATVSREHRERVVTSTTRAVSAAGSALA